MPTIESKQSYIQIRRAERQAVLKEKINIDKEIAKVSDRTIKEILQRLLVLIK